MGSRQTVSRELHCRGWDSCSPSLQCLLLPSLLFQRLFSVKLVARESRTCPSCQEAHLGLGKRKCHLQWWTETQTFILSLRPKTVRWAGGVVCTYPSFVKPWSWQSITAHARTHMHTHPRKTNMVAHNPKEDFAFVQGQPGLKTKQNKNPEESIFWLGRSGQDAPSSLPTESSVVHRCSGACL